MERRRLLLKGTILLLAVSSLGTGGARTEVIAERPDSKPQVALGGTLAGVEISEDEWDSMVERVSESAFKVVASTCAGKEVGSGSGFSVGRRVVTNRHVTEDADRLHLIAPDLSRIEITRWVEAGEDDLALLDPATDLRVPAIDLAVDDPRPGDIIAAVGYPLGGDLTTRRARVLDQVQDQDLSATYAVATSASVRPGDSGGVLVNAFGSVVAVTTAIALKDNYSLAVPVSRLHKFIDSATFFNAKRSC